MKFLDALSHPEYWQKELHRCERGWREGRAPEAVADAMDICIDQKIAPQEWMVQAVRELARRDLTENTERKWDMIRFARWDAVRKMRDRKGEPGLPRTWDQAFEAASELLERSPAEGTASSMRKSYERVRTISGRCATTCPTEN